MTVTLTMDTVLSRVRLTADGLGESDRATVERSTDLVRWTTVRGGAEIAVPVGGLVLPGTAGNYATTPDNAALDIVGDIDLRADATLNDWTGATYQTFLSKWRITGNQRSYWFGIDTTGKLELDWSNDGIATLSMASTVAVTPGPTGRLAVRVTLDVDNGAAGKTGTFYTAPTIDGPWVQLGAPVVVASTTSIFSGTAPLDVGIFNAADTLAAGTIHAVQVRNLIDGTVVANPRFWNDAPTGATGFTDSATRVWTVLGTAQIQHREIKLDDYEFAPSVSNTYRVRGIETGPITFVGVGTAATANNANVTPALPVISGGTLVPGDAMVAFASIRNSGTGTVNVPAGWSVIRSFGNVALIGKRYAAGDAAPTITFTGGVANADTIGRIAAWRRASITPVTGNDQLNASAQNIGYPALSIPQDGCVVIAAGWKQDDYTSVATLPSPFVEIGETSTITGDDASEIWDYQIQTTKTNITAGSFVVTGGAAAISRGAVVALPHADYLNEQTAVITPTLDAIWLKSVTRPFLNRAVTVVDWSPITRPARSSSNDVVGRSLPISVTDVRGSRRFTYSIYTATDADRQILDFILASGDILFVHIPVGCPVPGGYVRVDTSTESRISKRAPTRIFTLPVVESAVPGPDVAGVTATWDTILAAYPTWDAVLAAFPTWDALLELHGSPSEVIVP